MALVHLLLLFQKFTCKQTILRTTSIYDHVLSRLFQKSPPPVETNVPPVKTKSKDEKPDKSQKGSNKAKKPTAGTAPSRDVKAGEEKGRKSPKLVPGSSGSGRKSPGLSIPGEGMVTICLVPGAPPSKQSNKTKKKKSVTDGQA